MIFIDFKPKNNILKYKFDFWHQNAQSPKCVKIMIFGSYSRPLQRPPKTQHMLFLGYYGASGYPKSHQKLIFCEYGCNIRKKAAIKSVFGWFDFFIILLCNSAYFQAGKKQKMPKMLKTAKI